MASNRINELYFSTVFRNQPNRGAFTSERWNSSLKEIQNDINVFASEWNNKLIDLLTSIPYGLEDSNIDAYVNGIDGKNLWVDHSLTVSSTDKTFYDESNARPHTIEESLRDLYTYVNAQIEQAKIDVTDDDSGLTTTEKNKIGINIFDGTKASTSESLDGKSENNRLNILQLSKDLYGTVYSLDNDGVANLVNSVKDMVAALLTIHNGTWDTDVTLSHTGMVTVVQADINSSDPGNDSYAGSPSTLINDLDKIRTNVKTLKGTATWATALPALYSGGADSLYDLLFSTIGTSTKTSINPWGYNYTDITGLNTRLEAIRTFTGQTTQTDTTPTYTSTNYITTGNTLEVAAGKLDAALYTQTTINTNQTAQLSALETFVGQNSDTDNSPDYSSVEYIADGDSLETAIGKLDYALSKQHFYAEAYIISSGETTLNLYPDYTKILGTTVYLDIEASGFNHSNGTLTYAGGINKFFKIESNLCFTATASGNYSFGIHSSTSGILFLKGENQQYCAGITDISSVSNQSILRLTNGEQIEIQAAKNETYGGDITVRNLNLSITPIN